MVNPIFEDTKSARGDSGGISTNAFFVPRHTKKDKVEAAKAKNTSMPAGLFCVFHSSPTSFPDGRHTLAGCPDPKSLYYYSELKLARKASLYYREGDAVSVYNAAGGIVHVDELPETLYPRSAAVVNVVLN